MTIKDVVHLIWRVHLSGILGARLRFVFGHGRAARGDYRRVCNIELKTAF
ncbi:MAG: hypothetical protein M0R03_13820 [Novosphingobium sp.]|nr:hypothetical protein [Novosphingobium sp.]